jgi:hypothetical protein
MPQQEPDRVKREIEELLDRLDNFVPEERLVSKIKKRRKDAAGPSAIERGWAAVSRRFSRITLGHVMIAGLALLLAAWLVPDLFGGYAAWATVAGFLLTGAAFVFSIVGGSRQRTVTGARHYEKRWRGQVIEYSEPSAPSRLREWLRGRRRR